MTEAAFSISDLFEKARVQWLTPAEVLFILENHEGHMICNEIAQKPTSGSLLLYNKKIHRFFRNDGHDWRKKKETHEKHKVDNEERLICYHARGEHNVNFERRSYWMLHSENDHIALVHYRDTHEVSPASHASFSQGLGSSSTQQHGSSEDSGSSDLQTSQALRRIEERLGINEDGFPNEDQDADNPSPSIPPAVLEDEMKNWESILDGSKSSLDNQGQTGISFEDHLDLTTSQKLKFTIREISPEWGLASKTTKVVIIGSFLCDPSESKWACMFGDVEVPAQIIQDGVIRCYAPPHLPGKVTLCVTSANRESCSEVIEFDYC